MRIATHNVKVTLDRDAAKAAVETGLAFHPDVFGLQEWGRSRRRILAELGTVVVFPKLRDLIGRRQPTSGWVWVYPIGGQPIGYDASVFEFVSVKRVRLSQARRGVRATYGTELVLRPRRAPAGQTRLRVPFLNVHPIAHRYRHQNALAGAEALRSMDAWADEWSGFERYLLGDFNDATVHIPGMHECPNKGTHNGHPIDKILGPHRWADARTFRTTSDHRGLVADEEEKIR